MIFSRGAKVKKIKRFRVIDESQSLTWRTKTLFCLYVDDATPQPHLHESAEWKKKNVFEKERLQCDVTTLNNGGFPFGRRHRETQSRKCQQIYVVFPRCLIQMQLPLWALLEEAENAGWLCSKTCEVLQQNKFHFSGIFTRQHDDAVVASQLWVQSLEPEASCVGPPNTRPLKHWLSLYPRFLELICSTKEELWANMQCVSTTS